MKSNKFIKRQTYPKTTDDEKRDLVKKLRFKIKSLEKENNILKNEAKQLRRALNKSLERIEEFSDEFSLEQLMEEINEQNS